jgi:hypothetical protein
MGRHSFQTSTDYEEDYYAWTQRQAKLLRSLGKADSKLPQDLDLDHLAEEIEALGKAELRSVTGLIRKIFVRLIKAVSQSDSPERPPWRAEATAFQIDLPGHYAPSMRQLIEMDVIWKKAVKLADVELQEQGASLSSGLPTTQSPYSIDHMLAEDFDFDAALRRLSSAR